MTQKKVKSENITINDSTSANGMCYFKIKLSSINSLLKFLKTN